MYVRTLTQWSSVEDNSIMVHMVSLTPPTHSSLTKYYLYGSSFFVRSLRLRGKEPGWDTLTSVKGLKRNQLLLTGADDAGLLSSFWLTRVFLRAHPDAIMTHYSLQDRCCGNIYSIKRERKRNTF